MPLVSPPSAPYGTTPGHRAGPITATPSPAPLRVDLAPEVDAAERCALLRLLDLAGVVTTDAPGAARLYYGPDRQRGRSAALWIQRDSHPLGAASGTDGDIREVEQDAECPSVADLLRAARFWLELEWEQGSLIRDAHGRVPGRGSLAAKRGALHHPPVNACVTALRRRLRAAGVGWRPDWPAGKRYAVALTHDVDVPERTIHPLRWARGLVARPTGGVRPAYWHTVEQCRAARVWGRLARPVERRAEWDFDHICELEGERGLRSAFYFACVTRRDGHACDVAYDVRKRRYAALFERLRAGGWEIGLHAAYGTRLGQPPLSEQIARLHRAGAGPIVGVRHHYLQVDRRDPLCSLREQAQAGLQYDTTLGFNDCPGFRCGVAMPYRPFIGDAGPPDGSGDFVELPMTLADMHLPRDDVWAACAQVAAHLGTVRRIGGLAVLNWHVGNWHTAPAWRESYRAACRWLAEDAAAWVATPGEIAAWWRAGRAR